MTEMYYYRETCVMINQSVNEFYTRSLLEIDALNQDVALPLDIFATLFNNLGPEVRELLISEGVQAPPRPPTEKNHQGKQRLILVKNAAVEAEKNTRTIKVAVQPAIGSRHPRKLIGTIGRNPSTKMDGLCSRFRSRK